MNSNDGANTGAESRSAAFGRSLALLDHTLPPSKGWGPEPAEECDETGHGFDESNTRRTGTSG